MSIVRNAACGAVLTVLASVHANAQALPEPDSSRWLEDFEQLKTAMTLQYANLEWAVNRRGVDLRDLSTRTAGALRAARSNGAARQAMERFVDAFGDGHFWISWPTTNATSPAPPAPTGVCARNGYRAQRRAAGVAFDLAPEFRALSTPDSVFFPVGVLRIGLERVGVLRISSFEDNIFPSLCERAATELHLGVDSTCIAACADALDRMTGNEMGRALARQIEALQRERVTTLIVDITRNGGGTNWVEVAARTIATKPLLAPRRGFIRHPHHARQLTEAIAQLVEESSHARGAARRTIDGALGTLRAQLREASTPCDRSAIWHGAPPNCQLVFAEPVSFSTGVLRYARPGSVPASTGCCPLYHPARYVFHESLNRSAVVVLVDNNTASAAEYFAAMLADNRAAVIAGVPTAGSGCGYTNGGIPLRLKHSEAVVRMPDCVRFRADGTNEVEGVTPHIPIPWRSNDSPLQRVRHTMAALPQVLSATKQQALSRE